ncbi:MAG: glycosyltransferase family 4 protein [Anaerolineaceae bacterium]|nr:glycosyltransferase family 4 protein [Anaerolineaceae bacterium]
MHILVVADGRSPTTRRWIQGLLAMRMQVTVLSTYPCAEIPGTEKTHILPIAFGGFSGSQVGTGQPGTPNKSTARRLVGKFRNILTTARYSLGPWTLPFSAARYRKIVQDANPDLVHAMRIPFEGMLAAYTPAAIPLIISIWGNDLTLHAYRSARMMALTTRTLRRANGLLADAHRDLRLAQQWGYDPQKPSAVVPGAGGIDLTEINRQLDNQDAIIEKLPTDVPLVINPRGFRPGSVRNDTFFQSIPLVLERNPNVYFICPGMAGQPEALRWVEKFHLEQKVGLLPFLTQSQLWNLFHRAVASISISSHDGTPNTLLEAMACGCFPIAGDIESIREWITPGINGMLVQPDKAQDLAEALLQALDNTDLREKAAAINQEIIIQRGDVNINRERMLTFYKQVIGIEEELETEIPAEESPENSLDIQP